MAAETQAQPTSVEEAQNHVLGLFQSLCGAPDDEALADAADDALRELDELLGS
jgi:hypothetical protein